MSKTAGRIRGLILVTRNGSLVLEGPESSKRKLYRELLKKELNEDFLNISELSNVYPELDLAHFRGDYMGEIEGISLFDT